MSTLSLSTGFPEIGGHGHRETASNVAVVVPNVEPSAKTMTDYEQLDDHSLMAAIKEGDHSAFSEIVRRYQDKITNHVYYLLHDYETAVDISQETFIRLFQHAERYRADFSFSTYIYRIAQNLAISVIRQRKRRGVFQMPFFTSDKDGDEMEVEVADHRIIAPEDLMIDDERLQAVRRAITTLPENYRIPLVLRDVEEKSYEEIGEILNLPDGTVKSRINRARNLLKEKLRDYL
jgi:RNA polymerase sigma-70 factor (ECF subfamily)